MQTEKKNPYAGNVLKLRAILSKSNCGSGFNLYNAACKGAIMRFGFRITTFWIAVLLAAAIPAASAESISREQLKGLDEQVQEIKSDVLAIAAELNQLEERLLFPSNTQMALFVSIPKGEKFRLDSVQLKLGDKPVAHHIYSFKELEALQKGGVQRIYTGNVRSGDHDLQVEVAGKSGGSSFALKENFTVTKKVGPKIVEISLSDDRIAVKDE